MAELQTIHSQAATQVEYRPIIGFENYRVGSDGSVWSRLQRSSKKGTWQATDNWTSRSPVRNKKGYASVRLRRDGRYFASFVSHLVLTAFVGPRPDGQEARHGVAGNRDDSVSNLCWGTRKENTRDQYEHGTRARGERSGKGVLTEALVISILAEYSQGGVSYRSLAKKYRIDHTTLRRVVLRKLWGHVQ